MLGRDKLFIKDKERISYYELNRAYSILALTNPNLDFISAIVKDKEIKEMLNDKFQK